MKSNKVLFTAIGLCMLLVMQPVQLLAQFNIGASYEIRQAEPKNGFGARLETGILGQIPVVDLRMRAHFSYFNEENQATRSGITYSQEITDYDYGIAALAGVSVGLVKPYAGLGIGSNTLDVKRSDMPNNSPLEDSESDSKLYWNGFIGAEVSPVPFIKPFVEYRFENVSDYQSLGENLQENNGRMIFGVLLTF